MITDIFNKDIVKIMTLFSVSPGSKFTRKEIQDKTLLNNVPLDKSITVLLNNKILKKEKRLLSWFGGHNSLANMFEIVSKEYMRFKEIPLMEDVELMKRMRKQSLS